ncbi:MAG: hypothetical protein IPM74_03885 [Crocinitomicaceae bacterium]|nr:hypothetical protein [Crocinitomicaceae bacterium]MBK8925054.1 hypothetical protein [Crocinitomicaceae bacterium]
MSKKLILIWSFVFVGLVVRAGHPDMSKIRDLFAVAATDEEACNELYKLTSSYSLQNFPVYYAYNAAAEMTQANHTYWPNEKLSLFNAGKERLEEAVTKQPNTVEIRFIRYCVQQGCPFFLDYDDNLDEDKKFILGNLSKSGWSETYQKEVKEFLNS